MDAHVMSLDAQHCLAIAAAFIAIIGACASLIGGANSKADSLTNRIHEAAKEFREVKLAGNAKRCAEIKEEVSYYDGRYKKVQHAQRLLFSTIGIFIICLTVFISLALSFSYTGVSDVMVYPLAQYLMLGIGVGVGVGALVMLIAIGLHFWEVRQSYKTLQIEMRECQSDVGNHLPAAQPQPAVAASVAEPARSRG